MYKSDTVPLCKNKGKFIKGYISFVSYFIELITEIQFTVKCTLDFGKEL